MGAIDLFTPVRLGPYELPNRIVLSPMTRNRANAGGVPGRLNALYYAQRATAGLIVTEASQISPQGVGYPGTPGIHSAEQMAGWRLVTQAVHEQGGRIFLQLFHGGRISHPFLQPGEGLPVAPSALRPEGEAMTPTGPAPFVTPRALELEEIPGIVEDFRTAAQNALDAGFDGVEVHAANGYLPDQFLRDGTNRRTDAYGGSPEERARFALEIVDAAAKVWGAERVGVHISPANPFNSMSDADPEATFGALVEGLSRRGPAYLHVSEIDLVDPGTHKAGKYLGALNSLTLKVRARFPGTYVTNGGYDRGKGIAVLGAGDADLVAFGRPFIANPDLPERFARGAPLAELDPATLYGGGEKGYTDYPALG